jgi:hypothetical protein
VWGRTALVGLLVVGGATACSSSGSKGTDPECVKLTAISHRLVRAERDLFTNRANGPAALSQIVGPLQDAQTGAPPEIRQALAELVTAFQTAEQALRHSTKQSTQQLARAASVLSEDGKKVGDYAAEKCT